MRYHDITKDDMKNGEGLRCVLWVSGCNHCCRECQNPQTWDPNGGLAFDDKAKAEIFSQLEKSYISGLTFSGGDPLHFANVDDVTSLAKEIKQKYPSKNIWLYTGYTFEEVRDYEVMKYIDVLVDGEFVIEQRDVQLMWKGSKNQRVIDVAYTIAHPEEPVKIHCADYYDPSMVNIGSVAGPSCDIG